MSLPAAYVTTIPPPPPLPLSCIGWYLLGCQPPTLSPVSGMRCFVLAPVTCHRWTPTLWSTSLLEADSGTGVGHDLIPQQVVAKHAPPLEADRATGVGRSFLSRHAPLPEADPGTGVGQSGFLVSRPLLRADPGTGSAPLPEADSGTGVGYDLRDRHTHPDDPVQIAPKLEADPGTGLGRSGPLFPPSTAKGRPWHRQRATAGGRLWHRRGV